MHMGTDAERNLAIYADFKHGFAAKDIARRFSLAPSTVTTIIRGLRAAEETVEKGKAKIAATTGSFYLPPRHGILQTRFLPVGSQCAYLDVEPLDAVYAAYDQIPYLGGKYPKGPRVGFSAVGSSAAMCVDAAG